MAIAVILGLTAAFLPSFKKKKIDPSDQELIEKADKRRQRRMDRRKAILTLAKNKEDEKAIENFWNKIKGKYEQ